MVNSTHSFMNMFAVSRKPIFRLFLQIDLLKSQDGKQYTSILSWDKIDICKYINDVSTLPRIRNILRDYNKTLEGILHKCPYNEIKKTNISFSFIPSTCYERPTFTFLQNGYHKFKIRVYSNREKNIFTFQYIWNRQLFYL